VTISSSLERDDFSATSVATSGPSGMKHLFRCVLACSTLAASGCSLFGRAFSSAPEVHSFPTSIMPELDAELIGLIARERPFDDKEVRKLSVTEEWGPWFKEGGVEKQALRTSVGVYDPQNRKCWVWNQVFFTRPKDGAINYSVAKPDNNKIDCELLAQ
jgi:hypothetical protein